MGWAFGAVGHGSDRYFAGLLDALRPRVNLLQGAVVADADADLPAQTDGAVKAVARTGDSLWRRRQGFYDEGRRFLKSSPNAVVATHFAPYAAPLRSLLRRTAHVVHFHGPWAAESRVEGGNLLAVWAKHRIECGVYRSADRCITLSQAFADVLVRDYCVRPDSIQVIPGGIHPMAWDCGVSRSEARDHLGWPIDRPIILCVRRLSRRMGIGNLIEAVSHIKKSHPEALVIIGGSGALREELQQQIISLGNGEHVRLIGFVTEVNLPFAYRAADMTIVPTQSLEGFGLVAVESLAAGTPVMVTPVGGLPEVVNELQTDLVLEGCDANAIAAGIASALSGSLQLPAGDACRAYARERFDWSVIAEKVLDVYRETHAAYE